MSQSHDTVLAILFEAVDATNLQLPASRRLAASPELALVGPASGVDSLTLVSFVVEAEDRLNAAFGTDLLLGDMIGLPPQENPFRSLDRLADALAARVATT